MKKAERWKKKLELLVIIFVLMSFAGWIWEVAIHLVEDGVFVKRGVLSGPWLPIYWLRQCADCIISGKIPG